uniref:Transposase Tc1-like domain-containing protein n=1 Tax=Cyprinus carpio carpio TaxID=630221 RepID=A0A9J7X772_CYPCA
ISERIGCSQSAVSRHLSGKSVGRKKCGKKRCTRRGDRTLRKIVEKDRFQTLGDLRKQWTESGVETSRATKRLTWATEKQHWTVAQWSKVLFSDESKFCMS